MFRLAIFAFGVALIGCAFSGISVRAQGTPAAATATGPIDLDALIAYAASQPQPVATPVLDRIVRVN